MPEDERRLPGRISRDVMRLFLPSSTRRFLPLRSAPPVGDGLQEEAVRRRSASFLDRSDRRLESPPTTGVHGDVLDPIVRGAAARRGRRESGGSVACLVENVASVSGNVAGRNVCRRHNLYWRGRMSIWPEAAPGTSAATLHSPEGTERIVAAGPARAYECRVRGNTAA